MAATAAEAGWSPNLDDQLATVAFNRKDYATALEMWQRILPTWKADELLLDLQPVFSARAAAVAAARLGRWDLTAEFFGDALQRSDRPGMPPWRVGLIADHGFALWQSGSRRAAVAAFRKAVELLDGLPNTPESFAECAVQKLVGFVLSYLVVRDDTREPPAPGLCSNLSPSESIKDLPPTPTAHVWFLLFRLAWEVGDEETAAQCAPKLRESPFAFLRAMAAREALERCLKGENLAPVLRLATAVAVEMEKASQRTDLPGHEPDPPGLGSQVAERQVAAMIRPAAWIAIMRATVLGMGVTDLVKAWGRELDIAQPSVIREVALYMTMSERTTGELNTILRVGQEPRERRLLAAVLLLGRNETSPEDAAYAQAMVIDSARHDELLQQVGGETCDALVRRDWLRLCDRAFMLRSPLLYVAIIRHACQSEAAGWASAARIVLTALPTTRLDVPEGSCGAASWKSQRAPASKGRDASRLAAGEIADADRAGHRTITQLVYVVAEELE